MNMALDHLGNAVSSAADFDKGGEDIAYALYDLARGGHAASAICATISKPASTISARRWPRHNWAPP